MASTGLRAWALPLSSASKIKATWWDKFFWNAHVQGHVSPLSPLQMRKQHRQTKAPQRAGQVVGTLSPTAISQMWDVGKAV